MRFFAPILAACILLIAGCDSPTNIREALPEEWYADSITVYVTFVYDGDTFQFKTEGREKRVRILGIDCFETQPGERLNEQAAKAGISADSALALGNLAKDLAFELIFHKNILIYRKENAPNTDVYDRLLRYAVVDGKRYDSIMKAHNLTVPG